MTTNETTTAAKRDPSETKLAHLLQEAGPRPEIPERDLLHIRSAAEESWRTLALRQRKKTSRRRLAWAAAATLAAIGLTFVFQEPDSKPSVAGPSIVAKIAVLNGTGWIEVSGSGERHELREAEPIGAGSYLETLAGDTEASRMALQFQSGANLRLDRGTRILVESENRVELVAGAVYLDSEPTLEASDLVVATALGNVYEIGTQFEARLDAAASLRIRVREGAVRVEHEEDVFEASLGHELTVLADGSTRRDKIPLYGPDWDWILQTSLPLPEGISCDEFLHWVEREAGWQVERSADLGEAPGSERLKHRLSGVELINDQDLADALYLAMQSCRLSHSVYEGRLQISSMP